MYDLHVRGAKWVVIAIGAGCGARSESVSTRNRAERFGQGPLFQGKSPRCLSDEAPLCEDLDSCGLSAMVT